MQGTGKLSVSVAPTGGAATLMKENTAVPLSD